MSRKRRVFDISMPVDDAPVAATPAKEKPSRGPMASAIAENAEALTARKSAAEAIREENDALAHEFVELREAGHVVQSIPLDDVHTYMLVRDRIPGEDLELESLMTSIQDLGLSNPIRVFPRPDGAGYELVQGYRRLSAYKALRDKISESKDGAGAWDSIPALVLPGEEDIAGLYRRMVDENVIRKDLSFAEMAHAAKNYAADPATEANDLSAAVAALFQSAPYSKRSYIRSFALLLERVGEALNYPTEIPRALGVTLARELRDRPDLAGRIKQELNAWDNRSIKDELDVLRRYAGIEDLETLPADKVPAPKAKPAAKGGKAKTTFHIRSSVGQVKCTAGDGRLEIKVDRDFTSIDRARLEAAIASLVDGLG
ncbi:ParB/RepB/Spo0J family partition protein [Cognatishimia activa]|uniref:Plasmid partitioning protein RepB n=1 Tax=Cognatishimia activa TaxID=1715691 RepID=A0A0P1IQU6_9RHOB|nr:ParB N-terminal domain-containing protein [Cognatishimia activa]CUJ16834.1 plasmid partitioning protein RepB [Cognatishimia activa]CUK25826.1 plasmid partitioning protein RepB [Cognatishimia activa]